jgi:hypothetical protein
MCIAVGSGKRLRDRLYSKLIKALPIAALVLGIHALEDIS